MNKTFAIAEVKSAASSEHPNGEFDIVMSTDAVDRDGEIVTRGAFDPLPSSIPVHAFHDFNDPIGRVVPSYDENGRLVGRGYFAATPRAQEIRQLVADGVIGHTSVGFMAADRTKAADGQPPQVTSAELLEVSFVSVPSNREAAVLAVKDATTVREQVAIKAGDRLQAIHDLAGQNGAKCVHLTAEATPAPEQVPDESAAAKAADPSGTAPASDVVDSVAATRVDAFLLGLDD